MDLNKYIRDIRDFPKPGILFKDITPLLADHKAFAYSIDKLVEEVSDLEIDTIGAFDSRGFIFAPSMAQKMNIGFFPIRKKGKLPYETISESYGLEYGKDEVEIHVDAVKPNQRVLLLDDLLATGGTMKAGVNLVNRLEGKVVAGLTLIELEDLKGKDKLAKYDVRSVLKY